MAERAKEAAITHVRRLHTNPQIYHPSERVRMVRPGSQHLLPPPFPHPVVARSASPAMMAADAEAAAAAAAGQLATCWKSALGGQPA